MKENETSTDIERLNVIKRHLSQSNANINSKAHDFQYTIAHGVFSPQQRIEYEKNGFVVVKSLIKPAVLDKYKKRFQDICSNKTSIPCMTVMKDVTIAKSEFVEGEKAITKIQDFTYDDELFEYCCLPEIVDHVKSIVGENVMAMHTMLINKPPGESSICDDKAAPRILNLATISARLWQLDFQAPIAPGPVLLSLSATGQHCVCLDGDGKNQSTEWVSSCGAWLPQGPVLEA